MRILNKRSFIHYCFILLFSQLFAFMDHRIIEYQKEFAKWGNVEASPKYEKHCNGYDPNIL